MGSAPTGKPAEDAVGPVLRMCEEVDMVVQSILDDNPERVIDIFDKGSYVRVQTRGFMRVRLVTLRRHLGASFEMRQLGSMLSAFAGRITTTSDEMTWSFSTSDETKTSSKGEP